MTTCARFIGATLVIASMTMGAACAPASAPPAPATTAKPAPTAAQPAATAVKPAIAPPAATASAKPAAKRDDDRAAEWEQTVAAAKKEGKIAMVGSTGDLYRNAALAFQKTYPEIQVSYSGMKANDFTTTLLAERNGGQYLWDFLLGGATSAQDVLKPGGYIDPVKPAFMLPEVLENSKWVGGLDSGFMDKDGQYIFGTEAGAFYTIFVNRDTVPETELNTFDQLLDPKWKGKITSGDLRTTGTHNGAAAQMLMVKGEDWLKKLFDQDIVLQKDDRAEVESVVRGRMPIMLTVNSAVLQQFRQEGLGTNIKPLDPGSRVGMALSSGTSHAMLINKAPHPNAAKVYLNWFLSREGQQAYVDNTSLISRRLDVSGGDPYFLPKPGVKYDENQHENMIPYKNRVLELAKQMFK